MPRGSRTATNRLGSSARIDQVGKCTLPGYKFLPKMYGASLRKMPFKALEGLRARPKEPMLTFES